MNRRLSVMVLGIVLSAPLSAAEAPRHPLDPLTWQEYWTVLEVLHGAGHVDSATRFSIVSLAEPDKSLVWAFDGTKPAPRAAFAVVRQGKQSFEARVDLVGRKVLSWQELKGVQPNWLEEEFGKMVDKVMEHPDFVAAMHRRGIDDLTFLDCAAIPPGVYGTKEDKGRRIAHVRCNDPRGVRNTWAREIAGVTAVVDLDAETVLRVVDEGVVPLSDASSDFDEASLGTPREVAGPIHVTQPLGPGFELDGYQVHWQNWSFHVAPDRRVGPVVATVTYRDGEQERPVLYEGHLAEIFVPYMDPAFAWYVRNFLDAGEFNAGGLTKPLAPGSDCPDYAVFIDMVYAGDNGRPQSSENNICIFERVTGDPSWRHYESYGLESRPERELVVRSAAVLGNYDYLFDWTFRQNGSIVVGVGATGIAETKVVAGESAGTQTQAANGVQGTNSLAVGFGSSAAAADKGAARPADDAYGHFVDRHIVAVNHDHYFSFRLDLDVDGATNDFDADRLVSQTLPADHPRRSIWVVEPHLAQHEGDAQMNIDLTKPTLWRVLSSSRKNAQGYRTSYQLLPGRNGATLLAQDDYPRRRAGFIDHNLWVTPYSAAERYAAGDYPTESEPGQGLPAWTRQNRAIEKTDIVLWHTIAMHHVVRAEDWPVMPVMWHTFELRPFDFFDRNPALDLPQTP